MNIRYSGKMFCLICKCMQLMHEMLRRQQNVGCLRWESCRCRLEGDQLFRPSDVPRAPDVLCGSALSGKFLRRNFNKIKSMPGHENLAPARDEGQSCSNPCQLTTSYHIKGTQRGDYCAANFRNWFNFWWPRLFRCFSSVFLPFRWADVKNYDN